MLSHYWDIYVHRTVRGISFIFVAIDAAGDLFSLISLSTASCFPSFTLVFEPQFDVLGAAIYSTELILWIGIMLCGVVFNLRQWLRSKHRDLEAQAAQHPSLVLVDISGKKRDSGIQVATIGIMHA